MKINTEKFIQFLKEQIHVNERFEDVAKAKHEYIKAYEYKVEKETYEWLLLTITGEQDTDLGEFMEEVEE